MDKNEKQKKLGELKKSFFLVKNDLINRPQPLLFAERIWKAIEISNEYYTLETEDEHDDKKNQDNELIIELYEKIKDIHNFNFLKTNSYIKRTSSGNPCKTYDVTQLDNLTSLCEFFRNIGIGKDFLLNNCKKNLDAFRDELYNNYLGQSISPMYQLQNLIQERYYHCKNCKNYEDFIKKYKTITKIAKQSKILAKGYGKTSMYCFGAAFVWFLLCWFIPYQLFQYNYFGEIFIFLSNLLFKLPSFVLCLVGVKFLYLFVQYKTEEREFAMLDSYLEKLPDDCKQEKAELIKQLAPHFFQDKKATKISQGFLQELLRKALEK